MARTHNINSEVDELGRLLTQAARSEADQRIMRNVKGTETGLVVSTDPLQIRVNGNISRPIVLGANEVAVLPTEVMVKGMAVILIRTVNDNVIAMPVVPGYDLQPLTGATGTADGEGDSPGYATQAEPAVGGPAGDRVINKALSYLGTKETGTNTDNGGKIDQWITACGLSPGPNAPWCGVFAYNMYKEAGVSDSGLAHPSCSTIISRAQSGGFAKSQPVKGCMAVTPAHVTLYISGPITAAECVGGNQSDAVTRGIRNLSGHVFAVPAALTQQASTTEPEAESGANSSTPASRNARQTPGAQQQR